MNNSNIDLFGYETQKNLLPEDGEVYYYGLVMGGDEAEFHHNQLLETIPWKHDEAIIYGKHIITSRKVAWFGDKNYNYTYSGASKKAIPWTQHLLDIKSKVEELTSHKYNSCLINLYHNGMEGMGWHSDDEASLGNNTTIASLSFGATRKFAFRHKITKQTISIMLESGSLLVMKGATQTNWQHSVLKSTRINSTRINLTFRTIITKIN